MRSEEEIEAHWVSWRRGHPPRDSKFDEFDSKRVLSEVHIAEDAGPRGDYVKLIQRMEDRESNPWIRFTYYRKRPPETRWIFAGQWSLVLALSDAKELLKRADREDLFD